jgi:hypothetical protein
MHKVLRTGAVIVFAPLLMCCGLALRCWLAVVGFVLGLARWELAWPPVERVEEEAVGEVRHCRSTLR